MNDTLKYLLKSIDSLRLKHIDTLNNCHFVLLDKGDKSSDLTTNSITILLALLAGLIALYQVKSNTISSSRITWIENVRTTLSCFCVETISTITHLQNIIHNGTKNGPDYEGLKEDYANYHETYNECMKSAYKAKMYLNPAEIKHKQVVELIDKIIDILDNTEISKINTKQVQKDINKIIDVSKQIFKEEWTKSKKLFKI